jgi:hypothetical protein
VAAEVVVVAQAVMASTAIKIDQAGMAETGYLHLSQEHLPDMPVAVADLRGLT